LLDGDVAEAAATIKPARRKMSAAHRAAIQAAQKARWKKFWAKKKAA
jgi:hypothetical protein